MDMASSSISDLRRFVQRRDLLPDVNGGIGRLSLSSIRYGLSDLALPDRFWMFLHVCREEKCRHNIFHGCYVLENGDSCSSATSIRFGYFSLVLILLSMLVDYINDSVMRIALTLQLEIKIM